MIRHGLDRDDVRRIPAQSWPVVAQLVRHSLFYVGMQHFEPFGMGAAEALAVGAPVLLSRRAGIARAIERASEPVPGAGPPRSCAVLVDPTDPHGAARGLIAALDAPDELARMARAGRRLAREAFSWPNGAARLTGLLDRLVAQGGADRRRARGQHRLASAWRGDRPRLRAEHAGAPQQPLPRVLGGAR